MHFHVPKPLHGWRAFAGEVGIIVIGVLIALGAEQVAENFHQRAELRDAEQAMTSELRDDDLPQAFARTSIYNCYSGQLDSVENAAASGDRVKAQVTASAYDPVYRSWDDEAWKAALASQVLVHSGSQRMIGWSTPYILIELLSQDAKQEADELPQLHVRLSGDGPISASERERLFQAIADLRARNRRMAVSSLVLMRVAGERGLRLTPAAKEAVLSEARRKYGTCVTELSPGRLNPKSQLSYVNGALGKE
jgi:hypothetical protein